MSEDKADADERITIKVCCFGSIISSNIASIWAAVTALGFHIVLTKDRFMETAGGHAAPNLGKRQQRMQDLRSTQRYCVPFLPYQSV